MQHPPIYNMSSQHREQTAEALLLLLPWPEHEVINKKAGVKIERHYYQSLEKIFP